MSLSLPVYCYRQIKKACTEHDSATADFEQTARYYRSQLALLEGKRDRRLNAARAQAGDAITMARQIMTQTQLNEMVSDLRPKLLPFNDLFSPPGDEFDPNDL